MTYLSDYHALSETHCLWWSDVFEVQIVKRNPNFQCASTEVVKLPLLLIDVPFIQEQ